MVHLTLPCMVQPSKGVLRDFEMCIARAKGPFGFRIENNDIGEAANGECAAAFQTEQSGGLGTQQTQHAAKGHLPLFMQPAQAQAERRFKTRNAVGRVLELDFLFVNGVGRMVGGNGVDDAVEDGLDHGIAIGGRTQRRIHLGIRVVLAHVFFGKKKVVRSDFAGNAQSVAPSLADGGQRCRGGGVGHVQVDTGIAQFGHQAYVALNQAGFCLARHAPQSELECGWTGVHAGALGEAGVFRVLNHAQANARRGRKRFAHDVVFENGIPVIRNGYTASGF